MEIPVVTVETDANTLTKTVTSVGIGEMHVDTTLQEMRGLKHTVSKISVQLGTQLDQITNVEILTGYIKTLGFHCEEYLDYIIYKGFA
jgi:sporulation-control protein spo0M